MAILIIIFILLIERKPKEEKDKYIVYLHFKTSLVIKSSFVIGLFLIIMIGQLKGLMMLIFEVDKDNVFLSILFAFLFWLVYVLGVTTNIISIIYSFKMIFNNSKYEIGVERLIFHIIICGANLFIPVTVLYKLGERYF